MSLNKITTDALSFYGKMNLFNNLENTIIYISYSNYIYLKNLIQDDIASAPSTDIKMIEIKFRARMINFIKTNDELLKEDFLQSDPLPYIESKNLYIAIQKDTKSIAIMSDEIEEGYLTDEQNDTIYTAMIESTELLTMNRAILNPINDFELPIFAIDITDK